MTSKEALEVLFASYDFNGNYEKLIQAREKLEKDLEILDIFKKHTYIDNIYDHLKIRCVIEKDYHEEEFEKIKEWRNE